MKHPFAVQTASTLFPCLLALTYLFAHPAFAAVGPPPPLPTKHVTRDIEGWTVRVDERLLDPENRAVGDRALKLLTARLVCITAVMPEKSLVKLRAVPIQIDLTHGKLWNMQYHPSAQWLTNNGYSVSLAKCVHIPAVKYFLSPFENHRQPSAVLHELAHGYHDQVLGFDEPRIKAAWRKFRDSGKYKSVLTSPGGEREHYALTDQKEFFAEMTESYLAVNDFFPFVAGELKREEPEIFQLLGDIWGPLPGRTATSKKPIKVFILAGQSNMEGKAKLALLEYQVAQAATRPLFEHFQKDGKWIERDDVWIKFLDRKGKLTVGYGSPGCIGPELQFGWTVGDHYDEPVLLIKTAWGGRSLWRDFRPPSAGLPPESALQTLLANAQKKKPETTLDEIKKPFGASYREMLQEVNTTLSDVKKHFPDYTGQGYELAGFIWFQGWNDMIDPRATAEYTPNLVHFIHDVRKDLQSPKLPFVIAQMGVDGTNADKNIRTFKAAQAAVMDVPEFDHNVALVRTDAFWDYEADAVLRRGWREHLDEWNKVGSDQAYHYLGSSRTLCLIGKACAQAVLEMRKEK